MHAHFVCLRAIGCTPCYAKYVGTKPNQYRVRVCVCVYVCMCACGCMCVCVYVYVLTCGTTHPNLMEERMPRMIDPSVMTTQTEPVNACILACEQDHAIAVCRAPARHRSSLPHRHTLKGACTPVIQKWCATGDWRTATRVPSRSAKMKPAYRSTIYRVGAPCLN